MIAIIGGGVSGIFTAIALKKAGFDQIRIFEKSHRPANLTHSFEYEGNTFDYSTKLIPSISFYSPGIFPPLLELIEETGMDLLLPPTPKFFDLEKDKELLIPPVMAQFGKFKVVSDFARAFKLLTQLRDCRTMSEIYATGIVNPGEDIVAWGKRHKLESIAALTNYIIDLFNMGPSQHIPAVFVLTSRIHFLAPYFHSILHRTPVRLFFNLFGSRKNPFFHPFLNHPEKPGKYFIFKAGYQKFLEKLIEKYGLNITFNAEITDVQTAGDQRSFLLNPTERIHFDKLIFCCPPDAIAQLSPEPEIRAQFSEIRQNRYIRTWAFTVKEWPNQRFGKQNYIINGGNPLDMGGAGFKANGRLMYVAKDFAENDLIMSAVYADFSMTEEELQQALTESLRTFGLEVKEIVGHRDFIWPHHPNLAQCKNGFYSRLDVLQGQNGIYYSGESVTGIGVPTIYENALKFAAFLQKEPNPEPRKIEKASS